ncbi:MAG: nucleotidyltransferase domain-containing protein [Nanoarchaeota archaeon]|nr:nucleotidyltransferase domain-containing protein [Nanoarchaeota archaeon]
MDIYKLNFTRLELEILSYLTIQIGKKLSQREIAKALQVSPTAIAKSVKKLKEKELINIEQTKTINFITYNRDNQKAINYKRIENLRLINKSGIADFLEEQFPGTAIILFGSYSKGEDTIKSDIDIAIIGTMTKKTNLEEYEEKLQREIRINYYKDWKDIHKHLKNNILNGITLKGSIEL